MNDPEVLRLRQLRDTALRARAIAAALRSSAARRSSAAQTCSPRAATFSSSAVACWRIARVITGWLRAHPYPRYQQGPSQWRGACHRVSARMLAAIASHRGRSLLTLSGELRRVVAELDDARALTWSAELSDTFGRSQTQIRRLIQELDAGARNDAGSVRAAAVGIDARVEASPGDAGGTAANWPYLAF
jgi:hypothetical protein